MKAKETTLLILLDAFRYDYLNKEDTPYLWKLKDQGVYAKKLFNPGYYCERTCFMTGAGPEKTDNAFAMALMPIGYRRAEWEGVSWNVPPLVRMRVATTEDNIVDFEKDSFKNWTTGEIIESFWDVMLDEGKKFWVEACIALGIRSYKGKTTHGSRPLQLSDKFKKGYDFYYIQYSEVDNIPHFEGSAREKRQGLLKNVDGSVEWLVKEAEKHFEHVNVVVFGDHGMSDVTGKVDIPLDYPPYAEGMDYLFLKSSSAIQFWVFNDKVEKSILTDPLLRKWGRFVKSPSKRQGDLIWNAKPGIMLSPCHFHPKNNPTVAMHGWDHDGKDNMAEMRACAIVVDGKHKGVIEEEVDLRDICPTVTDLTHIRTPKYNEGKSLLDMKGVREIV